MTNDDQPVELTEAEREEITRLFGYVPDDEPLEFMLAAVARIKAAARREALLEARDYLSEQEQFDGAELVRALLAEPERDEESGRPVRAKPRLRACVEAWPGCAEGEYNPACCRFPKSCSCDIYDAARVGPEDLEEGGR